MSLKRKTPLRRKTPMKRGKVRMKRTPLKSVSKKRSGENGLYTKAKATYIAEHPECEACIQLAYPPRPTTDLHHKRGRFGRLLFDSRFFMAVCRTHHDWIHRHSNAARELGWLSPADEWGRSPKESS